MEKKLLCATFLEAAIRFYEDPANTEAYERWRMGKGGQADGKKTAEWRRQEYPNHVPLDVAANLLGVSRRQLSFLVAEGREPFCLLGANIGTNQRYARIYTERLIAYLSGEPL